MTHVCARTLLLNVEKHVLLCIKKCAARLERAIGYNNVCFSNSLFLRVSSFLVIPCCVIHALDCDLFI